MINEVAAGLLARARDDAAAVRAVIDVAGVTDAIVGFHAQQAVEKSIEAVLASREESFPLTHDLEGLLERCAEARTLQSYRHCVTSIDDREEAWGVYDNGWALVG